jgi:dihydropteroate synthase
MSRVTGEVDTPAVIDCGGISLHLDRPRIMGILNVTPDSFSDGGAFIDPETALARARAMAEQGADIIDVGGESSRPGAAPVSVEDELARVVPVISRIRASLPEVIISIDTCKPEVMRAAVAAGASLINDITALRVDGAVEAAAELGVPVCLMHMQGEPRTMQLAPHYEDVVDEVRAFLAARVEACIAAGIPASRLILDPGIGFGKTVDHNLELLARLDELAIDGLPLLVGASRKSMIGALLGRPANERLYASIALATIAAWQGASILRVHDVGETADALVMCDAVKRKVKR